MPRPQSKEDVARWVQERFGIRELREGQTDVILGLLRGRRQVFVAPTGHGKSLCYQAIASSPWSAGVVLVFQPLIALMGEQVLRARAMGLRAECVNSDQAPEDQVRVLAAAVRGELDLLFLAPERQGNSLWLERVPEMTVKGVVIDEAHCISQWGHDFRPWYQRLVATIVGLGLRTPVLAVTATAPQHVVSDIEGQLAPHGESIEVLRLPSHRENIECAAITVNGLAGRMGALLELAKKHPNEPGIAYTLTTDEADMAARFLTAAGIPATTYTGRMSAVEKAGSMGRWQRAEAVVMCATSALGMGLDRADLRWVAHLGLPDSLIRYVQEIGRVGRDGRRAWAIALHDPEVEPIHRWMLESGWPAAADYRSIARALSTRVMKRQALIEITDIPKDTTQRILDDLRQAGLVRRDGTSPYVYSWVGGVADPVPAAAVRSRCVRQQFLEQMLGYANSRDCRAVSLARAMEDDTLPEPCGQCDRCRRWVFPDLGQSIVSARRFLTQYRPKLSLGKGYAPGVALSRYGMGEIGEAVKESKYRGTAAPAFVLDAALETIRDPAGPYADASLEAVFCLPSTRSGDYVPELCRRLAGGLGIPLVILEKTRPTEPQKRFRSRHHKRKNVRDAFRIPADAPEVATALLVDDIWDSGESLKEAARLLRPTRVYPFTLARTKGDRG